MSVVGSRLWQIGWMSIVGGALIRVMTEHTLLPYWDIDPLLVRIPETRLTPKLSLALDTLCWFGAILIVVGCWIQRREIYWRTGLLLTLASIGVFWHGLIATPYGALSGSFSGDPDSLVIGSTWLAAGIGAWGVSHLATVETWRRATILVLLGVLFVLVGEGVVYVAFEHAATLREYQGNPELFLQSRGIDPDSVGAREFERRLSHPDPVAWFGLSNVFATFCAAGCCAGLGAVLSSLNREITRNGSRWVLVVGSVLFLTGGTGLLLSSSKGGIGAALIGVLVVLAAFVWHRFAPRSANSSEDPTHRAQRIHRHPLWAGRFVIWGIPVTVLLAPLIVVLIRGLLGETLDELSLLFRWHYLIAASRMIVEHPLLGVGPATFQNAYLITKPALSPEAVQSPHNILWAYASTLGIAGISLAIVWLYFAIRACSSPFHAAHPSVDAAGVGPRTRFVAITAVAAAIVAWSLDAPVTSNASVIGRTLGLVFWIAMIVAAERCTMSRWSLSMMAAGAAAVFGAHAQIEVTGTHLGSVCWCFLFLAAAGSVPERVQTSTGKSRAGTPFITGLALTLLIVGCFVIGKETIRASLWERELRDGKERAHWYLQEGRSREAIETSADTMNSAEQVWGGRAALRSRQLGYLIRLGARGDRVSRAARSFAQDFPGRPNSWLSLAEILSAMPDSRHDEIQSALKRASELDPGSLQIALTGVRISLDCSDDASARAWGAKALRVHDRLRLDPLKQLRAEDVDRLQDLIRERVEESP